MRARSFPTVAFSLFLFVFATLLQAQTTGQNGAAKPKTAPKPARPVSASSAKTSAAPTPKTFTNADVLSLKASGLSDDEMVAAIGMANNKAFDVSGDAMKSLVDAGISRRVRAAILGIPYVPEPVAAVPPTPPPPVPAVATPVPATPAPTNSSTATGEKTRGRLGFLQKLPLVGGKKGESAADGTAAAPVPKAKKLPDGEPAAITTPLPLTAAADKVKEYFNRQSIDFTVNQETGRIISDWYGERRCGPGFYRCANRANVRLAVETGQTIAYVQVMERKREGGINEKPWKEGSTSKGKETSELAAELTGTPGAAVMRDTACRANPQVRSCASRPRTSTMPTAPRAPSTLIRAHALGSEQSWV